MRPHGQRSTTPRTTGDGLEATARPTSPSTRTRMKDRRTQGADECRERQHLDDSNTDDERGLRRLHGRLRSGAGQQHMCMTPLPVVSFVLTIEFMEDSPWTLHGTTGPPAERRSPLPRQRCRSARCHRSSRICRPSRAHGAGAAARAFAAQAVLTVPSAWCRA